MNSFVLLKKLFPLISLTLSSFCFLPEARSDIFTFDQSSSNSASSPSTWTIELSPNTNYRFSSWSSSTDTWLRIYQGSSTTAGASNDDTNASSLYTYSEGLVDGFNSAADVSCYNEYYCSSISYSYSSGDNTHTLNLSSYAQVAGLNEENAAGFGGLYVTDAKLFSNFDVAGSLTAKAQPYAAMQHVGLDAINNQTSLVLNNAGKCKNNGWTIDDGKYCVFAAASNSTTYVYEDSTYGGYDTANFTSSYGVELNHNDKWIFGLAYGNGTSNFGGYDFSDTTASFESDNNFYSAYAVKQVNEDLIFSWLVGASDHDYDGSRTYSGDTATSSYKGNGYAAAMNAVWDKNVIGKKGRPYVFQPKLGLAYASHDQDSFSESGDGSLLAMSQEDVNTVLAKGGIDVSTKLIVNKGKNIFVPRLGLGYEMDMRADWDTSDSIKAKLTSSTSDPTAVKAKTIGKNKGFVNVGGDYYLTDRLLVNANASLKVTGEGSQSSYGGGFSWFF